MYQHSDLEVDDIPVDSQWVAMEDANLKVIAKEVNLKHVLIEVVGSQVIARGSLSPKPHRTLMSIKLFISTFVRE